MEASFCPGLCGGLLGLLANPAQTAPADEAGSTDRERIESGIDNSRYNK